MSATEDVEKGAPLPDGDHVLRYVRGGLVDGETGKIHASAFVPSDGEKAASVNWLKRFPQSLADQIVHVANCRRLK
jgi:hypothetical protein